MDLLVRIFSVQRFHKINDMCDSLKAEWLYSQGRGRQFRVGEQEALVQYLTETCPLNNQHLETEQERKLRLILSKAQHHQQQLRQEQPRHGKGESDCYTSEPEYIIEPLLSHLSISNSSG